MCTQSHQKQSHMYANISCICKIFLGESMSPDYQRTGRPRMFYLFPPPHTHEVFSRQNPDDIVVYMQWLIIRHWAVYESDLCNISDHVWLCTAHGQHLKLTWVLDLQSSELYRLTALLHVHVRKLMKVTLSWKRMKHTTLLFFILSWSRTCFRVDWLVNLSTGWFCNYILVLE